MVLSTAQGLLISTLFICQIVLLSLSIWRKPDPNTLILGAIAIFLGYGNYKLSYNYDVATFAYAPLGVLIIAILWCLYITFTFLSPKKSDWGEDVKGLMKSNEEAW